MADDGSQWPEVPVADSVMPGLLRRYGNAINGILNGASNARGEVTLTASAASTAVTDRRVGINTVISFMATTANAAAEIGSGTMYVSSRGKETFTITHANNAQSDRTFIYSVSG